MTDGSEITYQVADPVAVITLTRPRRLNAWTPRMESEFHLAVRRASEDPAVVGIVVTGAGRAFCAGADLDLLGAASTTSDAREAARGLRAAATLPGEASWGPDFGSPFTALLAVPKPVVAAINGPAVGVGFALALCCDVRFAAVDAVITTAFAERGLVAEWGASWLLPRIVGTARAFDILAASRRITGADAAAMGLVHAAVDGAEVVTVARRYIEDLATRCSPRSLAIIKRQINQQSHLGLGEAEAEAFELMLESFGSPDLAEGLIAYREGRAPSFPRLPTQEVR